MSFDYNKAFEPENGVILSESGAGLFSGGNDPTGFDAPVGSYFYGEDSSLWQQQGPGLSDWVLLFVVSKPRGKDHNNLITTETSVATGTYTTIASGAASGEDGYPPNTTFRFVVEGSKNGGGDMDVRLYNDTDAVELATLNFNTTVPTIKEVAFTFSGGSKAISIQARRTGSQGRVDAADIVMEW